MIDAFEICLNHLTEDRFSIVYDNNSKNILNYDQMNIHEKGEKIFSQKYTGKNIQKISFF